MISIRLAVAATALAAAGLGTALTAAPAEAAPDTACQKAGIKTLQAAGLLDVVARGGLPIATAVSLGVTPRDPASDLSSVPDPIPFSLLLADHRAGDQSVFVYPWC